MPDQIPHKLIMSTSKKGCDSGRKDDKVSQKLLSKQISILDKLTDHVK